MQHKPDTVGVIGAGSFGTTLASILAENIERVYLYTRQKEIESAINLHHSHLGLALSENIVGTRDPEHMSAACRVLLPVLPSAAFRNGIQTFAPFLRPYHVLIHGTKGFDRVHKDLSINNPKVSRSDIKTMSQVIQEETQVVRIGALSGPNLSAEIRKGLPTASVVASDFDEVISIGAALLSSPRFKIYGSHDILGTEFAGSLKNMIAIGTGLINGLEMGKNIEAMFLTRGLREMLVIGQALGANAKTFFGTAGIGDLIATATSHDSRNFRYGLALAQGNSVNDLESNFQELAEGVRTVQLMYHLSAHYKLDVPIVEMLYAIIFKELPIDRAVSYLMDYPYTADVDFLDM